ncbi:hypothetical protein SAMN04487819_103104 [Actinopolyspora alba]|uniref:Cell division protein FtsL n=1 Tax=Actinopolyspora alba TaxID=673379 RepID=A0A1I1V587_9ACTN|nr:hypothetical protein [Actinopolyspora alba]SFD77995.1 hypothetical protein SAMN04487819_103104 [Actinopolyspora alba]
MTAAARGGDQSGGNDRGRRQRTENRNDSKGSARANRRTHVRSSSGERAYERKQERGRRSSERAPSTGKQRRSAASGGATGSHEPSAREVLLGSGLLRSGRNALSSLSERIATSRVPFVGTVVVVLVTGIVATLWLSIAAVGNSYHMQESKQRVQALSERKEDLLRSVSRMSSISEIRRRAELMNMVPVSEVAHLVRQPDGSVRVVGEPRPAEEPESAPQGENSAPEGDEEQTGDGDSSGQSPPQRREESPDASEQSSSNEASVG